MLLAFKSARPVTVIVVFIVGLMIGAFIFGGSRFSGESHVQVKLELARERELNGPRILGLLRPQVGLI